MARCPFFFSSTETVVGVLWDITLAFFVAHFALVYAGLALVLTAAAAFVGHAAVPVLRARHAVSWLSAADADVSASDASSDTVRFAAPAVAVVLLVGLCARALMAHARIPRIHALRLAIGTVAAAYLGIGWLLAMLLVPALRHHGAGPMSSAATSPGASCHGRVVSLGVAHASVTMSTCAALNVVFVAAVALMPWLSMILLERSSRRDRSLRKEHRRGTDSVGAVHGSGWSSAEYEKHSKDNNDHADEKEKRSLL